MRLPLLYNLNPMASKREGLLCLECGRVMVSWSRHDYKTCGCPNGTMVDGGTDYLRYGANDMSRVQVVRVVPVATEKPKSRKKKEG